jgi:hypothetical protein
MCQIVGLFPQNNFVATAEDFDVLTLETELFWQPDCLAVAGLKYACGAHGLPSCAVYT